MQKYIVNMNQPAYAAGIRPVQFRQPGAARNLLQGVARECLLNTGPFTKIPPFNYKILRYFYE